MASNGSGETSMPADLNDLAREHQANLQDLCRDVNREAAADALLLGVEAVNAQGTGFANQALADYREEVSGMLAAVATLRSRLERLDDEYAASVAARGANVELESAAAASLTEAEIPGVALAEEAAILEHLVGFGSAAALDQSVETFLNACGDCRGDTEARAEALAFLEEMSALLRQIIAALVACAPADLTASLAPAESAEGIALTTATPARRPPLPAATAGRLNVKGPSGAALLSSFGKPLARTVSWAGNPTFRLPTGYSLSGTAQTLALRLQAIGVSLNFRNWKTRSHLAFQEHGDAGFESGHGQFSGEAKAVVTLIGTTVSNVVRAFGSAGALAQFARTGRPPAAMASTKSSGIDIDTDAEMIGIGDAARPEALIRRTPAGGGMLSIYQEMPESVGHVAIEAGTGAAGKTAKGAPAAATAKALEVVLQPDTQKAGEFVVVASRPISMARYLRLEAALVSRQTLTRVSNLVEKAGPYMLALRRGFAAPDVWNLPFVRYLGNAGYPVAYVSSMARTGKRVLAVGLAYTLGKRAHVTAKAKAQPEWRGYLENFGGGGTTGLREERRRFVQETAWQQFLRDLGTVVGREGLRQGSVRLETVQFRDKAPSGKENVTATIYLGSAQGKNPGGWKYRLRQYLTVDKGDGYEGAEVSPLTDGRMKFENKIPVKEIDGTQITGSVVRKPGTWAETPVMAMLVTPAEYRANKTQAIAKTLAANRNKKTGEVDRKLVESQIDSLGRLHEDLAAEGGASQVVMITYKRLAYSAKVVDVDTGELIDVQITRDKEIDYYQPPAGRFVQPADLVGKQELRTGGIPREVMVVELKVPVRYATMPRAELSRRVPTLHKILQRYEGLQQIDGFAVDKGKGSFYRDIVREDG